jgi:hypothetical protein
MKDNDNCVCKPVIVESGFGCPIISTLCEMACASKDIVAFLECIRDNRLPPDVNGDLQKWYQRV